MRPPPFFRPRLRTRSQIAALSGAGIRDPFWNNVVFLWEANGVDEDAGPWVDAKNGRPITGAGGTKLDSAHAPSGATTSFLVSVSGGFSVPDNADWDLSDANSDAYTIEFSAYQTDLQTWDFGQWGASGNFAWLVRLHSGGTFIHYISTTGSDIVLTAQGGTLTTNAMFVICAEKNTSGKVRLYQNGSMVASGTPADSSIFNSTATLGSFDHASAQGWISRIRITKGVARYDSDSGYTPATGPFPTS